VDDVVVKTRDSSTLIDDLEETFASLREYRWKLNPNKCVFGVPSGKLLGFIISQRGIEANPEKISAITSMKAPMCIKDVQKLTECMAALNRFILKLEERGLPFFKLLKHQEKFVWTPEADQALAQLKDFLSKPPVLTAPREGEQLLLYPCDCPHPLNSTKPANPTPIVAVGDMDTPIYTVHENFISTARHCRLARLSPGGGSGRPRASASRKPPPPWGTLGWSCASASRRPPP
jgi:hypothetical protein